MARHHSSRRRRTRKLIKLCLALCAMALILAAGIFGTEIFEKRMNPDVENAGMQMTSHTGDEAGAHVFMNDRWYRKKDVETLLVIGIDNYGEAAVSDSYNNRNQADFLALFVRDLQTGESRAIHLNRDTMADITVLGVTGQAAGVQRGQLALAYTYGKGQHDSCRNTAEAVSRLLYGMEVDHYLTITMDAVPILNDWAGGVTVKVMEDMTGADSALVYGEEVTLMGQQALTYVRTRKGLDDSSNISRMKRQRQYASEWMKTAQDKLQDAGEVAQLVMQMSDYHYSDCTAEKLAELSEGLSANESIETFELPGEAAAGEEYMEFYADDEGIQQLVLDIFYQAVE